MLFVVPLLMIFLGLAFGYAPLRLGRGGVGAAFAGLLIALALYAIWREASAHGMDVLLYPLFLFGVVVPGLTAQLFGACAALIEARVASKG
jgi:hypothetical protein